MILITGASGFIGKNLVPDIAQRTNLRILVRRTSDISLFKDMSNVEIVYGDIENNIGIEQALDHVDIIVHCAARTIGRSYSEYYRTNTLGTLHLVNSMKKMKIKKILYLSSHAASGPCVTDRPIDEHDRCQPVSFYGRSKKSAEDVIIQSGLRYIVLRPVAVYGPFDMDILKYIRLLNNGVCPIVGSGRTCLNMLYVRDLVNLILDIVQKNRFENRTYFVSDGMCYPYKEILKEIQHILARRVITVHVPKSLALFYALLNDIFMPQRKRLIWRDKVREMSDHQWLCCSDRITHDYQFTPQFSLSQGMRETIDWYKAHGYLS